MTSSHKILALLFATALFGQETALAEDRAKVQDVLFTVYDRMHAPTENQHSDMFQLGFDEGSCNLNRFYPWHNDAYYFDSVHQHFIPLVGGCRSCSDSAFAQFCLLNDEGYPDYDKQLIINKKSSIASSANNRWLAVSGWILSSPFTKKVTRELTDRNEKIDPMVYKNHYGVQLIDFRALRDEGKLVSYDILNTLKHVRGERSDEILNDECGDDPFDRLFDQARSEYPGEQESELIESETEESDRYAFDDWAIDYGNDYETETVDEPTTICTDYARKWSHLFKLELSFNPLSSDPSNPHLDSFKWGEGTKVDLTFRDDPEDNNVTWLYARVITYDEEGSQNPKVPDYHGVHRTFVFHINNTTHKTTMLRSIQPNVAYATHDSISRPENFQDTFALSPSGEYVARSAMADHGFSGKLAWFRDNKTFVHDYWLMTPAMAWRSYDRQFHETETVDKQKLLEGGFFPAIRWTDDGHILTRTDRTNVALFSLQDILDKHPEVNSDSGIPIDVPPVFFTNDYENIKVHGVPWDRFQGERSVRGINRLSDIHYQNGTLIITRTIPLFKDLVAADMGYVFDTRLRQMGMFLFPTFYIDPPFGKTRLESVAKTLKAETNKYRQRGGEYSGVMWPLGRYYSPREHVVDWEGSILSPTIDSVGSHYLFREERVVQQLVDKWPEDDHVDGATKEFIAGYQRPRMEKFSAQVWPTLSRFSMGSDFLRDERNIERLGYGKVNGKWVAGWHRGLNIKDHPIEREVWPAPGVSDYILLPPIPQQSVSTATSTAKSSK